MNLTIRFIDWKGLLLKNFSETSVFKTAHLLHRNRIITFLEVFYKSNTVKIAKSFLEYYWVFLESVPPKNWFCWWVTLKKKKKALQVTWKLPTLWKRRTLISAVPEGKITTQVQQQPVTFGLPASQTTLTYQSAKQLIPPAETYFFSASCLVSKRREQRINC